MITKIGDGNLFAEINSAGAELWRVYDKNGTDYLWSGDSAFWGRRAPLLFPICGGMKDDGYIYDGKEYRMPKHGFCRDAEFTLEHADAERAVYLLKSDAERYALYPFLFELRIEYAIKGGALEVLYRVNNRDGKTMYFSIGSHEAYACPEGINAYIVEFEKAEKLVSLEIANNIVQHGKRTIGENITRLPMSYDYFSVDALCFQNLLSKRVSLVGHGRKIDVEFDGFEYVLLWTKVGAPFLCIELNCGIDDYADSDRLLEHKKGNMSLAPGEEFTRTHTMRFSSVRS